MIISHKYKFIFIKTFKIASTSIEVFLSHYCGRNDIVTPIYPREDGHHPLNYTGYFNPIPEIIVNRGKEIKITYEQLINRQKFYNHIPAYILKSRISKKVWRNYFKFCVERNPWDKTLSYYYMLKARNGGKLSLDEYISKGPFSLNYPIYTDKRNFKKNIVDHVVKYENLTDELIDIFSMLGIPFEGALNVCAKGDYRKDRRPYQEVYTKKQKNIIQEIFKYEIQMHGYTF